MKRACGATKIQLTKQFLFKLVILYSDLRGVKYLIAYMYFQVSVWRGVGLFIHMYRYS